MKHVVSSLVTGLFLLSSSGCASMAGYLQPNKAVEQEDSSVRQCRERLAKYEKTVVPDPELAADGPDVVLGEVLEEKYSLPQCIRISPQAEQAALMKRLDEATHTILVRAAKGSLAIHAYPRASRALSPLVSERKGNMAADVLPLLREAEAGRVKLREAEFQATKSYAGQTGKQCVLSKEAFPKPDQPTKLVYQIDAATTTVYVRCFSDVDLDKLTGKQGGLRVKVTASNGQELFAPLGEPRSLAPHTRIVDTDIELPKPAADVDVYLGAVELEFASVIGQVVEQGALKPRWDSARLARTSYLWER